MNGLIFYLLFHILAVQQPTLAPCPDSPNCVNSYQNDDEHEAMEPLSYSGSTEAAMEELKSLINSLPRTEITDSSDVYLKAVFTIALFGFQDDVEFLFDPVEKKIHYRSASRVGYYDLGVNRRRMKDIREEWTELSGTDNN